MNDAGVEVLEAASPIGGSYSSKTMNNILQLCSPTKLWSKKGIHFPHAILNIMCLRLNFKNQPIKLSPQDAPTHSHSVGDKGGSELELRLLALCPMKGVSSNFLCTTFLQNAIVGWSETGFSLPGYSNSTVFQNPVLTLLSQASIPVERLCGVCVHGCEVELILSIPEANLWG